MKAKLNIIAIVLFVLYLAVLMKLLVFKYPSVMTFEIAKGNYVPFKTILTYLSGEPTWNTAIRNIWGNIILLVPMGFFVSFFSRPFKWKSAFIAAVIIGTLPEIIQGIFKAGVFDVDDILLNVFGAVLGYAVFICVKSIFAKK